MSFIHIRALTATYKHQDVCIQATQEQSGTGCVYASVQAVCPAHRHQTTHIQAVWPGFLAMMQRTKTSATESSSHLCPLQVGDHVLVLPMPFCILLELTMISLSILSHLCEQSGFTVLCLSTWVFWGVAHVCVPRLWWLANLDAINTCHSYSPFPTLCLFQYFHTQKIPVHTILLAFLLQFSTAALQL